MPATSGALHPTISTVEVALLDSAGVIEAVNDAWIRFGAENGGDPGRTGVGMPYLEICDRAGDPLSAAMSAAIRAALSGDLSAPMMVPVPCNGPQEARFFAALVSTRLDSAGQSIGATVTLSRTPPPATSAPSDARGRIVGANAPGAPQGTRPPAPRGQDRTSAAAARSPEAARRLHFQELLRRLTASTQEAQVIRTLLRDGAARSHDPHAPVAMRNMLIATQGLVDASAGLAIDNVRLYAEAMHQQRWLDAATELTGDLLTRTSEPPLDLVLRHATRAAEADLAAAVIPTGPSRARVATVTAAGERLTNAELDLECTFAGRILRTGAADRVDDYDAEFPGIPRDHEFRQGVGPVVGVPLTWPDGEVWGAILVGRRARGPVFEDRDIAHLTGFAVHAGLAVTLDRVRTERDGLQAVADHERLVVDLHDQVIRELFTTGMSLQNLVPLQTHPEHQRLVLDHVDSLDATIRLIRTTMGRRPPTSRPAQGFRHQLISVLDEARMVTGTTTHVDLSGPLDRTISPAVTEDALAVARTALSRIARHTPASSVTLRADLADDLLTLQVTHDGTGLADPGDATDWDDLRRRAENRGGTLLLTAPPGGGTQLTWTARVPLNDC